MDERGPRVPKLTAQIDTENLFKYHVPGNLNPSRTSSHWRRIIRQRRRLTTATALLESSLTAEKIKIFPFSLGIQFLAFM